MEDYIKIAKNGLWSNNQALVALLGLCPLLAVTNNITNAIGLGLATTFVLVASNTTVSIFRHQISREVRIPIFVLLIASFVTIVELLMQSYFYDLYLILGIFVPLIVTNCAILGRAEAFASKNTWGKSALDGLMMGIGFSIVLVILGAMRELIGAGTLFDQSALLLGSLGDTLSVTVFEDYQGTLLAVLPPGAFIGLGLIVALKNWIDA
ncbi:Electron transport complex protein RnfE [Bathymodiolus thermophilus thioautotrophic gill symbiont]|uniref:Ion-translocating oxidoreductase complex subunit E n=1 Tax=Bathymodiolus thermophilus thioautotrophic gill symbiont TaxID=2360 RepID=A0A1J5TWP3_9GAMM|nr:electron transport complex subunit E [Bathymodiolus thermophilus thioautotrophic gill symbiont]AYQ56237.1 electron transport complex subunit RsxE [Bathymodiolus thermophilus thioautotrophic gill symbiont]OIR25264.1 electron transport complex subunit RsxE [Bathymodiolus thermophilus thioautotrophic gill symbiont]CAB5501293.1 Electron transport complex protein RnfE [Bathymodiolus thermophilus thioautotrophic gill symbiont]CAB5505709.1 Electron transport complex protein RnfE [Bathymodiolus ther